MMMQLVLIGPPVDEREVAGLALVHAGEANAVVLLGLRCGLQTIKKHRQRPINECLVDLPPAIADAIEFDLEALALDQSEEAERTWRIDLKYWHFT